MANSSPSRLVKSAALVLPLAVGGLVWWLASAPAPTPALISKTPEAARPVQQPVYRLTGSFGLPAVEVTAPDVFTKFDAWAQGYAQGAKADEVTKGVRLAQERREALKTLIQKDPRAALARALPWRLRNRMPQEVTPLLEQRVSTRADYSVIGALPAPGVEPKVAPLYREAILEDGIYKAFVYGKREFLSSKNDLPIEGIAVDDHLAILESPMRELEAGEPLPAGGVKPAAQDEHQASPPAAAPPVMISGGQAYQTCCLSHSAAMEQALYELENRRGPDMSATDAESVWSEGPKKILVIRVDFSDVTGTPQNVNGSTITPAFATNLINGVCNDFMEDVSYGKTNINLNSADVTPVLRMPSPASFYAVNYRPTALLDDSLDAAQLAGYNPDSYDRHMIVFSWIGPSRIAGSQFTFAGLGRLNGKYTWYNGYFDSRVVPHELGHNLNLNHANLWVPAANDPVQIAGGFSAEYEDPFDCMGNGFYAPISLLHFNPWYLNRLDWLPNSAIHTVVAPGTFRVYRYDHPNATLNRTLALKIAKDSTINYWLSYRGRFAGRTDSLADVSDGAYIIWGYNGNGKSQLIDVDTPGGSPDDASLNVGQTLHDTEAGIIMRVLGKGGAGVDEYLDIQVQQDNRIYPLQTVYDVDESAGSVEITLARSGEPNEISTVTVSTVNGSAVSPSDYTATSTSVTWGSADTSNKTVTIPITANATREGTETFQVNVTLTVGANSLVIGSPITVKIHEPGTADPSFAHDSFFSPGSVRQLALEPDGQVVFVGGADYVQSSLLNGLGRLTSEGKLDTTFTRPDGADPLPVLAVARLVNGQFVVGGDFTSLRGESLSHIGMLANDGDIDTGFDPGAGANGPVKALAVQADGRILAGGSFTTFDAQPRLGLARLMPDGSLDTSFLSTPIPLLAEMDVEAIVLQADGKILVGGQIRTAGANDLFAGGFSSGVLRLNTDGTVDESFDIGAGAHQIGNTSTVQRVMALALQIDGKVLVGGQFTAFNAVPAQRLVRLNTNGSLDQAFQTASNNGANGTVRNIEVQGDGRILLAGEFTTLVNGSTRNYVGRLLTTGALDTGFDAALPLTADAGGGAYGHRTKMQPDGRVLLALEAAGTVDTTVRRVFSGQQGRSGILEFANGSNTVNEGGQTTVEVKRTGGSLGKITVNYALIPGSADATDYVDQTGTLTWENGVTTSKFITIQAPSDAQAEATEFFTVQLGVPLGGAFLGDGAESTVAIVDPGAAGFPTVRFNADSSTMTESATGTLTLNVELTAEADSRVTVPIILGGTASNAFAGSNGDYRVTPSLPLIFEPGETLKTLTIASVQDNAAEGIETLTLRLPFPTGPALIGNPSLHTVTIVDDDQSPRITGAPISLIVGVGRPAGPFEVNVAGSLPLTVEWYLNNRLVPGINLSSYTIPAATLKHAGTYTLKAKNRLAEAFSTNADLVVLDVSTRTVVLPVGGKATFKMDAAGNSINYTWKKVGGDLASNSRATSRFDKTLSISNLELADSGTYICRVASPIAINPLGETPGEKFMDGAIHVLKVVDDGPEFLDLEDGDILPNAIVSGTYEYPVTYVDAVNKAPMTYTAAGLPAGLKMDIATGVIRGKPTVHKATPYDVTLTLANKFGKTSVKVKLTVEPLPTQLAGDYLAIVGRQISLNQEIGGRLDLKITTTGAFSGKLIHGGLTHALKGVMDVFNEAAAPTPPLPSGRLQIVRTGKPTPRPLELFFRIDPSTRRIVTATLGDGFDTVTFTGWKQTWDAKNNKADAFDGYHTLALEMPESIPNVPRGYGYGTLNVTLAGMATLVGKTGDGETISGSAFISETGEVAVFQPLYKTKPTGSLLGKLQLDKSTLENDDNDNRITGSLNWLRPETTTANARVYKDGFGPLDVMAFGGRYLPVPLVLGLEEIGNVNVDFSAFSLSGAEPSRNPDAIFNIGIKNKITLVGGSATMTTLKADAAKGTYSGKFTLEDNNPLSVPPKLKRPVTYQGLVVPTPSGLRGYGYFLLPQLPSNLVSPATTPTTSPILSGQSRFSLPPP